MNVDELAAECLSRIDRFGLARVLDMYPGNTWSKFFKPEDFLPMAADHALRYDQELPRESHCIDVGCGFGYVALALEVLGHTCVAWDAPAPVLKNVANMIPLKQRIFKTITREKDEQELLGEYDLIFLHGVAPLRDAGGWWETADYLNLGKALLAGLKPGGRMEWLVNRGDQLDKVCNAAAWQVMMTYGHAVRIGDNVIDVRRPVGVCV